MKMFPSFCYRRTRNQILQLLLHGNYVVAVLPTSVTDMCMDVSEEG